MKHLVSVAGRSSYRGLLTRLHRIQPQGLTTSYPNLFSPPIASRPPLARSPSLMACRILKPSPRFTII